MAKRIIETPKISFQEYGLSQEFLNNSCQTETFFVRIDGQLTENHLCKVTGDRFLELYKAFLGKK